MSEGLTVLGSGTMGAGIAQVAAVAGYAVRLHDVDQGRLDAALTGIERRLERAVAKGRLSESEAVTAKGRLEAAPDLRASVAEASIVIEAVPEKLELKHELLRAVEEAAPREALLGTNTSTLMISAIAAALKDPSRLIGIHFFNPVPAMKLIEVVMGPQSAESAYERTVALARAMQKETVRVREAPGFATSRINALIGNEAFRMLEAGVASAGDIDKALKLGLAHPMGPFEMVDLVGLDARLNNLRALHEQLASEAYRPTPLLEELVAQGRLGKKSGHGVYRYDEEGRRIPGSEDPAPR